MPTKKYDFDKEVISVLMAMDWQDEGRLGILTCGQLDRKLYLKVNMALEVLGGKWNRKKGGHVFAIDPRNEIDGLIENGTLIMERDGFFETPPEVIDLMLSLAMPIGRILEPSAGLGAIVDRLHVPKEQIVCIEKNLRRANALSEKGYVVHCADFLKYESDEFDTVFMNPPFETGQDIDHVRHAYHCLANGGTMVSIMSEGPFFREDKKAISFREWLKDKGYSQKLPEKSFHNSGTDIATRVVIIYKTRID